MKSWLSLIALFLVPGGLLIASLELLRRRHAREHAADYVTRIQVLKPATPMSLPAVRPLRAVPAKKESKRRRHARSRDRVTRFAQRLKA